MRINGKELEDILKDHLLWLNNEGGERANLDGANLVRANLVGANLCGANLVRANLYRANLDVAILDGADLYGANLGGANLDVASLDGANLVGAILDGADLYGANLYGANLGGANLDGANLVRANLVGANLCGANLDGCAGDRSYIKSLFISDDYPITYTDIYLQIGCERHEIREWWGFGDDRIGKMDGDRALNFWKEWKDTIKMIIEKSPAKPTGYEEK